MITYLLLFLAHLFWFFGGVLLIGGERKVGLCIMATGAVSFLLSVFL